MYEFLEVTGEGNRRFVVAMSRAKGEYSADLASVLQRDNNYHRVPHIGVLALDYLRGAGTLIDVGANIGVLSIPAAVYGSNVLAVELLPENCLCLNLAILKNRLGNIRLFQLAAGAERRIVGFSGNEAWGHVVAADQGAPSAMLPLDDLVELVDLPRRRFRRAFVRPPVFIKIDTEGSEFSVLQGACAVIARFEPVLAVECIMVEGRDSEADRHAHATKAFLEAQGYHLYLHRGNRLVPRRASDIQEGHVCDFFASRRPYRPGARVGRFTVGPLDFAGSLAWVAEMAKFRLPEHRLHAVGVIARWGAEGRRSSQLDELRQSLLRDPDPTVAEAAARIRISRN